MRSPKSPIASTGTASASDAVESALRTLEVGSHGIAAVATALKGPLGSPFAETVARLESDRAQVNVRFFAVIEARQQRETEQLIRS